MNPVSNPLRNGYPRWTIVVVVIVIGAAVLGLWRYVAAATTQPTTSDYVHLQSQREVIDIASEAYGPLITDFATDYRTAYSEQRSEEARETIKNSFLERFERETELGEQRLAAMRGSVSLKDPTVAKEFEQFDASYVSAVDYLEQYAATIINISEATGVCGTVTSLDVSADDYEKNFVATSNDCLAALSKAKQESTAGGVELLTALEKTFTERQELFKKVLETKDRSDRSLARIEALVSLISINAEVKAAQDAFTQATSEEYDTVAKKANDTNDALSKTLKERADNDGTTKERN